MQLLPVGITKTSKKIVAVKFNVLQLMNETLYTISPGKQGTILNYVYIPSP